MRPTIGIDASPLSRPHYTGTERYTFDLISTLTRLDGAALYDWILYSASDQPSTLSLPANWKWKKLTWPLKRLWISVRLSLEMLIFPPDVLFVPANKLPLKLPKKTATTIHDIAFIDQADCYQKSEVVRLKSALKQSVKKADVIFTISQSTRDAVVKLYPTAVDKLVVTHLAVDVKARENVGIKSLDRRPYLLFIGTVSLKKNILYLLKLYERLRKSGLSYGLVILGENIETLLYRN